jgi:hypothetical protein
LWGNGRHRRLVIFLGGALSVLGSALAALSELLISGVPIPVAALRISLGLFFISALLEGAITLAVMQTLETINPNFIRRPGATGGRAIGWVAAASILLVTVGVLFASTHPDGIQKLAQAKTFLGAPMADYQASFFEAKWLRKAAAGLAGIGVIFVACTLCGRLISRQRGA